MSESEKYVDDVELSTRIWGPEDDCMTRVRRLLDSCLAAAKKDFGAHGKRVEGVAEVKYGGVVHFVAGGYETPTWHPATLYIHDPEPKALTAQERIEKALAEHAVLGSYPCQCKRCAILRGETR